MLFTTGEGVDEKKKEGIQLVTAVTDFLKGLDEAVKEDIPANIGEIVKQVSQDEAKWAFWKVVIADIW